MARPRTPAALRNPEVPADLFAGLRWRRGRHDGQKQLHMPPMNIQEIGRMAVMAYTHKALPSQFFATARR